MMKEDSPSCQKEAFEATHPGITIEYVDVASQEYGAKANTMLAGGCHKRRRLLFLWELPGAAARSNRMICLTTESVKTVQVGLRFIQEKSSDYHLIMAASMVSLIPVSAVFLTLQRYFIEGIATSGLQG